MIVCKGHVRFVRYIARRGNSCSTSPWGSVQLSSMTFFFTTHSLTHSFTYSLTPWQWLRLPRAQALEGAPAQLIGANFKKKIRPRQIIKVTSLQCRINLAAKVPFSCWRPFEALAPGCWKPSLRHCSMVPSAGMHAWEDHICELPFQLNLSLIVSERDVEIYDGDAVKGMTNSR